MSVMLSEKIQLPY